MSGRRLQALVVVALMVGTVACWPAPGQGPDRRSHNPVETVITPASVASLTPVWTATTDPDGTPGSPVVSAAGVHVSDGVAVYGFDAATGARRWRTAGASGPIGGPSTAPAIAKGDRVLLSWHWSYRGGMYGDAQWLDGATGAAVAAAGPQAQVDGVRGGWLAGRAYNDDIRSSVTVSYLEVVDTGTPSTRWRGVVNVEGYRGRAVRPVTLGTERVYAAGQFMDEFPTGPAVPPQPLAVRAYPLTEPPVCSGDGALAIRCPLWSTELDARPATSPVLGPGEAVVYVVSAAGTLYALDAVDGRVLGTTGLGAAPSADPALAEGTLYVPLVDGDLAAVPATECGPSGSVCPVAWRAAVGGASAQPAVAGGVAVTGTRDGELQLAAVAATGCGRSRCPVLWRHPVGAAVTGAPAVSGGRLYAGLADQRVVAFAPSAEPG